MNDPIVPQGGRPALLLVDLQAAFCSPDGSLARAGRDVRRCRDAAIQCQRLADAARLGDVPIIWTRMTQLDDYRDGGLFLNELRPGLRSAGALRDGTPDVELTAEVHPAQQDTVVDKPRTSALYASRLESLLRAQRIETVIVGGVTTAMCVESTVRDLAERDYRVLLAADACADWIEARHSASLASMEFGFAILSEVEGLIPVLKGEARL